MPKLPAPEDYGMSAPRPSRAVTEISPVSRNPVRVTPDLATGKVLMSLGEMMHAEAEKLDETVALDALNQLQNKQLDLTYGDAGFTKIQGKGVIDGKITQDFPAQLQREVERLQGTINSQGAKTRFQAQANSLVMGFKRGVYTHAAKETDTFHQQTEDATVVTQAHAASLAARAGNVENVGAAVAIGRASVEAAVKRRGLEGPQADAYRQKELGVIHSDIINGLLDGGQPALAAAWLKNSLKEMTVGQADKFDARVKTDTAWAAGDTFVREQIAAGKTTTEVEAALAADAKATGDKTKYDAGVHTLNVLNSAQTKTYAENADKAQDEINRGTPWGKVRAKYLGTMDPSVVAAFDQRAKALAKEGSVKTDFGAYYELSVMPPEQFAKVDLRTYAGKLSDANLRTLADRQGKILNKDPEEIKSVVTLQQQLGIAHNELGFGSSPSAREKKGMFDEYVVSTIREQQKAKGKPLTDEERDTVIKRAMITRNNAWNQFGEKQYYEVAGTPAAKDFAPTIPAKERASLTAAFVRKGKQPTEALLVEAYKRKHGIQ